MIDDFYNNNNKLFFITIIINNSKFFTDSHSQPYDSRTGSDTVQLQSLYQQFKLELNMFHFVTEM